MKISVRMGLSNHQFMISWKHLMYVHVFNKLGFNQFQSWIWTNDLRICVRWCSLYAIQNCLKFIQSVSVVAYYSYNMNFDLDFYRNPRFLVIEPLYWADLGNFFLWVLKVQYMWGEPWTFPTTVVVRNLAWRQIQLSTWRYCPLSFTKPM